LINSFIAVGNVGGDPDVSYYEKANVTKFSLAVDGGKSQDGGRVTEWYAAEAWGGLGDVMGRWIKRGSSIQVRGQLSVDFWSDRQTGEPRQKIVIKATDFSFAGSKNSTQGHQQFQGEF